MPPRVTEIIDTVVAKHPKLIDWVRWQERKGVDTKRLLLKSAREGTKIHTLVRKVLSGEKVKIPKKQVYRTSLLEDYFKNKKIIGSELALHEDGEFPYQGHLDYLYISDGKYAIGDLKTGRESKLHELQVMAYKQAAERGMIVTPPITTLELLYSKPDSLMVKTVQDVPGLWDSVLRLYYWYIK